MFIQSHYTIVKKLNAQDDPFIEELAANIALMCKEVGLLPIAREKYSLLERAGSMCLIFAIGGDGTMLEAMKMSAQYGGIAVGINMGRVGFLTDFTAKPIGSLTTILSDVIDGYTKAFVEDRSMLFASANGDTALAGNEVTVSQVYADSMICYRLIVGGMDAGVHRANAVMVATATGSTAYSLSAGGALMMPDLASVQIVPVAPLTMTSRPLVVPSSKEVVIEAWGAPVSTRVDGQLLTGVRPDHTYTKENPFRIEIKQYDRKAHILHLEGWNFFDVLTNKLGWIHE